MTRSSNKREKLIEAAKTLIHRKGYYQTTLAEIARESDVPLGNVYYYFRTKEELGEAVIDQQHQWFLASVSKWENEPDPKLRINSYLESYLTMKTQVAEFGCPFGSLCQELDKNRSSLSAKADEIIKVQLDWVARQFQLLGRQNAEDLALQFISTVQGCLLLANVLNDHNVMDRQFKRLRGWLLKI